MRLRVGRLGGGGGLRRGVPAEQRGQQTPSLVLGRPDDDAAGPYWVGLDGATQEPQEGSELRDMHDFLFCAVQIKE